MSRWKKCAVPNCLRPASCHGLCDAHYKRQKRGRLADTVDRPLSHKSLVLLSKSVWSNHQ